MIKGELFIGRQAGASEGGFFQSVPYSLPANAPLELSLNIGSVNPVPRMITLVLRNDTWSETRTCSFIIPAYSPAQIYTMRIATTQQWSPFAFAAWVGDTQGTQAIVVDNLDLRYRPGLPVVGTDCIAEPPANVNLLFNGDFSAGLNEWAYVGLANQVVNGTLEVTRFNGTTDGFFQQFNPFVAPANGTFEYSFRLGNSSSVPKTVNMVVRREDWAEMRNCFITLPPNTPLTSYTMRFRTNTAWGNLVVQTWLLQDDGAPALRVDDLSLVYRPGLPVSGGLECPTGGAGLSDTPFAPPPASTHSEGGILGGTEPASDSPASVPLPPLTIDEAVKPEDGSLP